MGLSIDNFFSDNIHEIEESDDEVSVDPQAEAVELSSSFTDDELSSEYLFLVVHGGCGLQHGAIDQANHDIDFRTLKNTLEEVLNTHYHFARGRVTIKSIPTPNIGTKAYETLSSLSPAHNSTLLEHTQKSVPNFIFPISALPILATSDSTYSASLRQLVISANIIYQDFLESRNASRSFKGNVCILADSLGSVMVYDILSRSSEGGGDPVLKAESSSNSSPAATPFKPHPKPHPLSFHHQHSSDQPHSETSSVRFMFDVCNLFMFGSPLGLILSHRQITGLKGNITTPLDHTP